MRISDWSSDVCSSDLPRLFGRAEHRAEGIAELAAGQQGIAGGQVARELLAEGARQGEVAPFYVEIVGDLLPKRQEGLSLGKESIPMLDGIFRVAIKRPAGHQAALANSPKCSAAAAA